MKKYALSLLLLTSTMQFITTTTTTCQITNTVDYSDQDSDLFIEEDKRNYTYDDLVSQTVTEPEISQLRMTFNRIAAALFVKLLAAKDVLTDYTVWAKDIILGIKY